MGGYGSGRWYRYGGKRDTCESCTSIDVRYLARRGMLARGYYGSLSWTRGGRPWGSIGCLSHGDRLELIYHSRSYGGEWEDVRETVPLTWTECNYGGRRPWFLCPGRGCGRRVAVLYSVGKYYVCRHCGHLAYETEGEDRSGRLLSKARRIRRRLGGGGGAVDPMPRKPKGMHWTTYLRLWREAEEAETMSLLVMAGELELMQAWAEDKRGAMTGGAGARQAK